MPEPPGDKDVLQRKEGQRNKGLSEDVLRASALAGRYLAQTLRLVACLAAYQRYRRQAAQMRPDDAVMSHQQFSSERQQGREGDGAQGGGH
jgi:uncharacterized short protein YbdD (DUF466 family)